MTLEFGPPKDFQSALERIPDRSHPDVETDRAIENCARLRTFLEDRSTIGISDKSLLLERSYHITRGDIALLHEVNSFTRNSQKSTIFQWSRIDKSSLWSNILPYGTDNYRWWEIGYLIPESSVDGYDLIWIETNGLFRLKPRTISFDSMSHFQIVFASKSELASLIDELGRNGS